jgi:O-antigen/teichoic acid export membrane protein
LRDHPEKAIRKMSRLNRWLNSRTLSSLPWAQLHKVGFSIADQALAVGGMFVANIVLARVVSKDEYGIFAVSYSIYVFFLGLHNALVLEPYTVFGSGRYHHLFSAYARLMWKSNALICGGLSALLLLVWVILHWIARSIATPALLGMALTCGVLMTGSYVRRAFYIQRAPHRAARFSLVFFTALLAMLFVAARGHWLTGFTTFAIAAGAWTIAALAEARSIPGLRGRENFRQFEPGYWREHWKYAKWVLATALVFQFMTQGYYWLVAGLVSVSDLAGLRAMHLLVIPIDQLFIAFTLLVLPAMSLRYATGRREALISFWKRYCFLFLVITGLFAISVHAFRRPLLHWIYGGKFDELSGLLGLLVLAPVLMAPGNVTNASLKAIERPSAVFYAYVASASVTLLAGIPLVIRLGLRGAVYGMLLSASVYSVTLLALWLGFTRQQSALEVVGVGAS